MRIGIIAEGHADIAVIKSVLKAITGIDTSEMKAIRPLEMTDETDNNEMQFSNWELVMQSCQDESIMESFFNVLDEEALLIVHVDTAERGNAGYEVLEPQRTGPLDWKVYSQQLRANVKAKLEQLVPEQYRGRIGYAIAIEETDAWIIPLYDNQCRRDTSSHVTPKEYLRSLIGTIKQKSKYIDTSHNNLNYVNLGKDLTKKLRTARKFNESLNLFCLEIEELLNH